MSNRTIAVTDTVHEYLLKETLREPAALARLRQETMEHPMSRMQIAPEQGQFMQLLAELVGARRCIEVGVFTGYSAACVAMVLPTDGKLVACDVSEEWTGIGRRYWKELGVDDKIELHLRPAIETLDELSKNGGNGSFDFAFIDADKTNYDAYYERCLLLLRVGGLIAIDNTLWSGDVANPENQEPDTVAIRALNTKVRGDDRVTMSLVPIGDGLMLARKR
jgi:predicted O-methyltransferase YrrM